MQRILSNNEGLAEQLAGLSPAKRALLELRMMQKNRRSEAASQVIPRSEKRGSAPLSNNQQGLWVLNELMPGATVYHSPTAVRLTGKLNIEALRQALDAIVARHDALRTTFVAIDGEPMQKIASHLSLEMPLIDLSAWPAATREGEAQRRLQKEAGTPFELSTGPLIRGLLVKLSEEEHILVITMHHIVTDGWSMGIFHKELSALYQAFLEGEPSPLPELPIQYADYAAWQRDWCEGEVYPSQLAYWQKQFETLPAVLELPTDHPRPNAQAYRAFRGAHHTITLSKQLTSDLKRLCQKENVTLFMALMAAYQVLLHRYTGEEDIVVGTAVAGR